MQIAYNPSVYKTPNEVVDSHVINKCEGPG